MDLLIWPALILIVLLFRKYNQLKYTVDELQERLARLEGKPAAHQPVAVPKATSAVKETTRPPVTYQPEPELRELVNEPVARPAMPKAPPAVPKQPKPSFLWLKKVEKQFAENWTGILGSAIMVIGVGFLGIYAALNVAPIFRFLLILAFAGLLFGGFIYLKSKDKWVQFGLWLRSSAAAITLFACLGAGGIEGLQWVYDPMWGLILLLAGIIINLYLSWVGGKQLFASLHVLLSLLALGLAPQNVLVMSIATLVCLFSIALTYRERWDYHLLLTITLFFGFHLFWYFTIKTDAGLTNDQRIGGIVCSLAVGILAALVHYREAYKAKNFDWLPFTVHLVNWGVLGVGLSLHATGSPYKTIAIALAAAAAFFLAKRARKLNIRWLYITDTLLAQGLALLALLSLDRWGMAMPEIFALMIIESALFPLLMQKEKEKGLFRFGVVLFQGLVLLFVAYQAQLLLTEDTPLPFKRPLLLAVVLLTTSLFHLNSRKESNLQNSYTDTLWLSSDFPVSLGGVLPGLLVILLYVQLRWVPGAQYGIAAIIALFFWIRNRQQTISLGIGTALMLLGSFAIQSHQLLKHSPQQPVFLFLYGLPFLVLPLISLKFDYLKQADKKLSWPGIYLSQLQLLIISYLYFKPVTPLALGIFGLIMMVVLIALADWLKTLPKQHPMHKRQLARYLQHAAYGWLLLFMLRHLSVHLQWEGFILGLKGRLLIELFAIGCFIFCLPIADRKTAGYRSDQLLRPLFLELTLLFASFTIVQEAGELFQPIIWLLLAIACLYAGKLPQQLQRLTFYSLVYYLMASIQLAVNTSTYVSPATHWYAQAWIVGLITIFGLFAYLMLAYRQLSTHSLQFPFFLASLQKVAQVVERKKTFVLLYPLAIGVAIFLYWSFDSSLLTILWVIECLGIFISSLFLRQQHFRYLALAGLFACIIRLIFFDLAQADTLARALVFLGVGLIMLFMNFLYKKYKTRFADE